MIEKIDKGLVSVYKKIVIDAFKNPSKWYDGNTYKNTIGFPVREYNCYIGNNISIELDSNNNINVKIDTSEVYTFKIYKNIDLLPKIIHLRRWQKHNVINKKNKELEEKMMNALSDEYKRSIKLKKIKNNIN